MTWIENDVNTTGDSDAFIAVSNDNGTSFNRQNLSIADLNGTTAAFDIKKPIVSGDNIYVTWTEDEDSSTDYKDVFIAVSNDNGASFNTTKLSIADPIGPTHATSLSRTCSIWR